MTAADRRVVVVTGASRGFGREIALRFGMSGDTVVVNYINREPEALAVTKEIAAAGGRAVPCRADVRKASDVELMMTRIVEQFGTADILVNNAGVAKDGVLLRMAEQDWDDVLASNLSGPFHCIRAASKIMCKRRSGHIVNIASIVGMQGREGQANYSASKAGLIGLTKACAKELGRFNIKVNAVLPGYLMTEMGSEVSDGIRERVVRENALARTSDPKEVAEFVFRLTLMNNVSGQIFNLDSRIV